MRRIRKIAILVMLPMFAAAAASAQNGDICDDLHGRLADLTETISTTHATRQYSGAMADQGAEIEQIRAEMRDRGCSSSSVVIINGQDASACDQLETSLDRMQENLRYLGDLSSKSQRANGSDDVLRDQIKAALRSNGCDDRTALNNEDTIITNRRQQPATPEQQAMRTDTFIQPLDKSGGPSGLEDDDQSAPLNYPSSGAYGANLQTMCVRTCDGGFFPLTTNASAADFQRDADTCSRMCPGVPTELYFRYLPDQESSEMVSASTGAPYSAMPYAFNYRKRAPGEKSSCTCNMSAYYEEMRQQKTMSTPIPPGSLPPATLPPGSVTHITTQSPQATPQRNTASSAAVQQPVPERPYDPGSRIRQVGPQFLAPDQGTIDLKHPLAPGPQPEQ